MLSVQEKKDFLIYFLNKYQLKRRESVWILNYIMSKDNLMEKLHFVEDAKMTPRGLVMSCHCADEVPFRYYKENIMTTDAEKSFHDVRLNQEQLYYVQLNFKNKEKDPKYIGILEDNPFIQEKISSEFSKEAGEFLDYCFATFQREQLLKQIDEAIDKKQKRVFNKLVKELNSLPVPVKKFKTVKEKVLN